MTSKVITPKKGMVIKGFARQDIIGHYITNSSNPFVDGKKKLYLGSCLNGSEVVLKIKGTWKDINKF